MNKYIVFTGNSYPHKNVGALIDAVKIVGINLKIISGRNVFQKRLKNEIKRKNAQSLVEVLDFVNDKDITNIYRNSVAFVFPTLEEGFGLPPMEAINAGTVAAVSNIAVLKEVYKDSVFYFDPKNTEGIASCINKILNLTSEERKKMIKSSQNFLKRYSWRKMAQETLNVYEQVGKS